MEKMRMESINLTEQNIEKIGAMFPNVITETKDENGKLKKAINFALLKQILADEVIDGDEAYEFTWVGKKASIVEAGKPIRKTLRTCENESKNWNSSENLYIEGDNIDVLKLLQESYLGMVDMIFIDPPYNTGSDVFVYNDSFTMEQSEFEEEIEYRDESGNIRFRQNNSANPRFHSDWLSMMYPRLNLARNLLSQKGVIFISIDDNEHANLKLLCDEIFGARCFIGDIVWRSSDNSNNNSLTFSEDHNYILVYSRDPNWKPNFLNDPQKRTHFKNPDNDPKGPWFDGNPVNNPGLRVNLQYNITTPSGKTIKHPANGWRWSWETVQEKLKTRELRFSEDETRLIRRTYLCDMEGLPPSSLCIDLDITGHTRKAKYELKNLFPEMPVTSLFSTPKPTLLIKYLISIGAQRDSIIMDFFSGSGTTAEAVMQSNLSDGGVRKFLMVQVDEPLETENDDTKPTYNNICEFSKERLRRAGEKIKQEAGLIAKDLDIGFRVLKLDSTNMKDVYYSADKYSQGMLSGLESNIKDDRNEVDLLFGCLLEWGLSLSLPHISEEVDGVLVHTINHGDLIACFAQNISEAVVKEIAKRQPLRAVFRDSSFANSPEKINVEEIFKLMAPNTSVKVL
jgi:adenine-specific DNA-methyltransferase